jgi:5'-phosphate synthase pdxT subunit
MPERIGVLAIQGDFEKHLDAVRRADPSVEACEIRTPDELATTDRLIIPGGESTTVGLLLKRFGLGEAIRERALGGMPIWGTCKGMILLARDVEGRDQYRLGLLDVTVVRNAFGAQIHSFEDTVAFVGVDHPVTGVFIRAPGVSEVGAGVEVLSRYQDRIVAVRAGRVVGTSFHPELTDDLSVHRWFMNL